MINVYVILAIIAVSGVILYFKVKKVVQETNHYESTYKAALQWLQTHPADPESRPRALEAGRAYYEIVMPDTANNVDNTANREARIAADIEARISHHRIAS